MTNNPTQLRIDSAKAPRISQQDVDMFYGQTPCLCGSTETWHSECYKGKTREQVKAAYSRVYRSLRKQMRKALMRAVAEVWGKDAG